MAGDAQTTGWRPIRTAPKARCVLVEFQSGEVEVCYQTDHGGGFLDTWRFAFARRGEQAPWPVRWHPLPEQDAAGRKQATREAFTHA